MVPNLEPNLPKIWDFFRYSVSTKNRGARARKMKVETENENEIGEILDDFVVNQGIRRKIEGSEHKKSKEKLKVKMTKETTKQERKRKHGNPHHLLTRQGFIDLIPENN